MLLQRLGGVDPLARLGSLIIVAEASRLPGTASDYVIHSIEVAVTRPGDFHIATNITSHQHSSSKIIKTFDSTTDMEFASNISDFSSPSPPLSISEMPMSPDLLAVVGNITIGKEIAPHHRSALLDGHCNPLHGLTRNHQTSVRTFKVLDALASLSVSCKERQVVAVGVQLTMNVEATPNGITITLADNDGVTPQTIEHVRKIWSLLRDLASIYAAERACRVGGGLDTRADWTGLSPPVPSGFIAADQVIARIACHVYTFTEAKFRRRVNRWWVRLRTFTNDLCRTKRHVLTAAESKLRECVLNFNLGLAAIKKPSTDWTYLVEVMDTSAVAATTLLENAYSLESMTHEMQSEFALRRALEKLTSHHRHFMQLISSAASPRLNRIFTLAGTIEAVPDSFDDITRFTLPHGVSAWRDVVAEICVDNPELLEDDTAITRVSEMLDTKLSGDHQTPCVHCECALAAHYETHRGATTTPPFSYIGVSKLSCMPCHLWLRALSAATRRNYYTRGTHGKWYRGWRMPGRWGDADMAELEQMMRGVLVERLVVTRGVRSGSDSTDASGCTLFEVSGAQEKARLQRLKESEGKDIE